MARRALRLLAWIVVGLIAVVALARMFLFGIYHVDSQSMEPALHGAPSGGDHLLVIDGGFGDLLRFDLVVVLLEGESEPRVKRVAALPREAVAIRDGILWIDDEPLPEDEPRPKPVLIFDEERLELEHWFRWEPVWERDPEGWALDAREVKKGSNGGLMFMSQGLENHYFGPDGELVWGEEPVDDAILECEARLGDPPARLRLGLLEWGDTFEAVIEPVTEGEVALRLIRRNPVLDEEIRRDPELSATVAEARSPFSPGFHALRFSNIDNRVRLEIDGQERLIYDYEKNAFHPTDSGKKGFSMRAQRVYLGGEEGRALFRRIRVLRDLDYTMPPDSRFAVGQKLQLGPDEIFVLGDHSVIATDGRFWGPTKIKEVIGRPLAVIWPPSRIRILQRAGEP